MSKEHDPSGTPTLSILAYNRYVIAYFGGAQVGNWKIVKDSFVVFIPDTASATYALYGRHNPALKDSLRLFFGGFSDESCFVSFDGADAGKPVMRRVFNESPNCMSYPNVYTFAQGSKTISFASESYDATTHYPQRNPVFTFNNAEGYNDFIAHHFPKKESDRPFYAAYKQGQLFFDQFADIYFEPGLGSHLEDVINGKGDLYSYSKDGFSRSPLPTTGEDATFINGLAAVGPVADTIFYNPFYKQFDMDGATVQKQYTFNTAKAAYLGKNYIEGEEKGNPGDLYNSENVLYLFKALPGATSHATDFTINEKPLFHFTCEENKEQIAY